VDDNIVTLLPVDRGGDAVLVTSLEGVDATKDLIGVTSSRGGVRKDQTNDLLGVDNEDGTDSESDSLRVDVGSVLVVDHVVGKSNLTGLISDDGEVKRALSNLVDVLDPSIVGLNGVGGQSNHLDVALGELGLELGEGSELGGADGSEVWSRAC
jgi:hypothetical protein